MATSLKKLLLVSVTLLLVMVSGGVRAQITNYDFTVAFDNGYGTLTGSVSTNGYDYIPGTLNVVSSIPGNNISNGTVNLGGLIYSPTDYTLWFSLPQGGNEALISSPNNYGGTIMRNDSMQVARGTSTFSVSTGAPEIDGSLAPKVGFLLGCLFLMFGRKKQDPVPMMTA